MLLVLIPTLAACSVAPALLAEDLSPVGARSRSSYAGKYAPEPSEVLPKWGPRRTNGREAAEKTRIL